MFPFPGSAAQGGNLEERLRGLIISNANASSPQDAVHPALASPRLPPHMQMASAAQQEEYLARITAPVAPPGLQNPVSPNSLSSQPNRKRPNQAQRRQMNSQMAIPIDTRPIQGPQAARGAGPDTFRGPSHPSWPQSQYNGYQQHPQGHQMQRNQQNQQNQQYGRRYQNSGSQSQQHQQVGFSQPSPQGPNHYQQNTRPQYQARQNLNQVQNQQPHSGVRPTPRNRQLFQPAYNRGPTQGRSLPYNTEEVHNQSVYLGSLLEKCIPAVMIDAEEEAEKEAFRTRVENACRDAITQFEQVELGNERFDPSTVELQCFGSMKSGFATKASDMDLALFTPNSVPAADSAESRIPRLLERRLLVLGYGARLLTRTRVPIIKLCEKPTEKLLSDLREERAKWDSGFVENDEDDEDGPRDVEHSNKLPKKPIGNSLEDQSNQVTERGSQRTHEEAYEEKLASLKQRGDQSLGDYYNTAKRLLRKLGGRDLSTNSSGLSEKEFKILSDTCKAFINGLSSESLSHRLRSYQSIAQLFDPSLPPFQRTLHGIWVQIEGEHLAMAWETRPITEANEKREMECQSAVDAWQSLQDKYGSFTESQFYNRQLFMASEKLKSIASLQLLFFEQLQHEEPITYYERAMKLQNELTSENMSNYQDVLIRLAGCYTKGVRHEKIRERLLELNITSMKDLAEEHQKQQLAIDYEHAIEVGLFNAGDIDDVHRYSNLLQNHRIDYLSCLTGDDHVLAEKMLTLPDPTLISELKPKDRYKDHLEFPKTDIGIQCDINFSANLAVHNTQLLRCYSQSDSRVKLLILFVKHWAKVRGINTPYRGTLSSYGYVLMVLHYLVNVAQPFVCPNLQVMHKEPPTHLSTAEIEARSTCEGRDVRFWRNEAEIRDLAERKILNHNHESIGYLLRGFFEYFAQNGPMTTVVSRSFDWGREVLSLRTQGGILTKQEKGWVGAKTTVETKTIAAPPTPTKPATPVSLTRSDILPETGVPKPIIKTMEETKEIRHRYLFAIEDPFELDHNVARTVTHNGIVSIRDEFRRAWRIIKSTGKGGDEELLDPITPTVNAQGSWKKLYATIHHSAPR